MHKNNTRSLMAVALAAVMPLSVALTACNNTPRAYVETGNTVTFNYNDGVSRNYAVVAEEGASVNKPGDPVRGGFSFGGWYTETTGGTAVTFPYTPTDDVTFYARWEEATYTVNFNHNDGTDAKTTVTAQYNSQIDAPTTPTYPGYNFRGWWTMPEGGTRVTFPYTVASDNVQLYAHWLDENIKIYNIEYDYNFEGGSTGSLELVDGEELTREVLPNPVRKHYRFRGWAESADATAGFNLPYTPTADVKLYAVWQRNSYNMNFQYNYEGSNPSRFERITVQGGDELNAPDGTPTRTGYTFTGWYTAARGGELIQFPYVPESTSNIYAHWESDRMTPENNKFDAEFTVINPTESFPGYSGNTTGVGIIAVDSGARGAWTNTYPGSPTKDPGANHYVTYLYKMNATITYEIYAAADCTATLHAALACDRLDSLTINPTGAHGYRFVVNGEEVNYGSITMNPTFREYSVGSVQLKAGKNVIQLITNNTTITIGGTTAATAPEVDYIRLDTSGSLTWSPVYDNFYKLD